MRIIIDSREPHEVIDPIRLFPAFVSSKVEIKTLAAGDCQIDDILVERKTISDLLASIADGRLFNQAVAMRWITEYCYLVICGPLAWNQRQQIIGTNWRCHSVQGALLKVQELGVCVVHAADDNDYPATLAWLANRDLSEVAVVEPRKQATKTTAEENVLMSLPGIGPERAIKLIEHFGTVANVLLALTSDVELPAGISDKTRSKIRVALGLSDSQYLVRFD